MNEQTEPSFLYRVGIARLITLLAILVIVGVGYFITSHYPSLKCARQDLTSGTFSEMSLECRPNDGVAPIIDLLPSVEIES
jgi:hypothetical protein